MGWSPISGRRSSGTSRPSLGHFVYALFSQDTFDHDKGQKSAISGRRLHWRLSTGFSAFSLQVLCVI